jgi:hypothetical protein
MLVMVVVLAIGAPRAAAETDCKSWLFGICTSRYTETEQAEINARKWLEATLLDLARAGPVLEQRLQQASTLLERPSDHRRPDPSRNSDAPSHRRLVGHL